MQALVIDDEVLYRRALAAILRRMGFQVDEAGDAQSGLARLASSPGYDVVLVDWRMPGSTGLGVVEQLRSEAHHARTRVIMVSGVDEGLAVSAALMAGADAYLIKPFPEAELTATLRALELLPTGGGVPRRSTAHDA
jgi:DNA-binding response OmpR family regulator